MPTFWYEIHVPFCQGKGKEEKLKRRNLSPKKALGRGIKGPPALGVKGGSCHRIDWEC